MRTICMMCYGSGVTPEQRATIHGPTAVVHESCRTCGGSGWYGAQRGPGVDPDRRHGSGRPEPA